MRFSQVLQNKKIILGFEDKVRIFAWNILWDWVCTSHSDFAHGSAQRIKDTEILAKPLPWRQQRLSTAYK